ncbi:MAG TPA: hypothetical protein DCZ94_12840 [Lentisphaeria bacterium]|nr:MAG: hypothetical protein A2X48_10975 [Lentisphaerae bacterium GWF2_49_21]HBC87834.1 hypothetical protein [Lentisphaeria bacterium]
MKKLMALVFGFGILAVLMAGCEGMRTTYHENQSTSEELNVPIAKLAPAIKLAAPKAGYPVLSQVKDTPVEGQFECPDVFVSYKKIDDNKTKIYINIGSISDPDKERLMLNEVKKALGIK